MSAFRYEAIDPTGRTLKGVLEATARAQAAAICARKVSRR